MQGSLIKTGFFTIPNLLSGFRLALIPLQLYLAWNGYRTVFLVCFVAQLLSDFLDGLLARRWNQTSELGARLDSWSDLAMYMTLPFCLWWLWSEVMRRESLWLFAAIGGYLLAILVGFAKFRRLTSYHTWGAKLSATLIPVVLLVLLAGGPAWPFRAGVVIFILGCAEEILMTLLLPNWRANVPSLWHALHVVRPANPGKRPGEP